MIGESDSNYLRSDQYRDARNLETRISFYERYATNPEPLARWIFERIHLAPAAAVLDVGCGNGEFWAKNLARVPATWAVTLTDLSEGVVEAARKRLADGGQRFRYQEADVQALPFPDRSFDAVLANHMLYHVPGVDKALSEIARVLRDDGILYAATNGVGHMAEIYRLERIFRISPDEQEHATFTCENGRLALEKHFWRVSYTKFEDSILATNEEDVVKFTLSRVPGTLATDERVSVLREDVRRLFRDQEGRLRVAGNTCLFEASGPKRSD